jgi:hypothetical protein
MVKDNGRDGMAMHLFRFNVGFNVESTRALPSFEELGLCSFCIAQSVEKSSALKERICLVIVETVSTLV